MIVTFRCGRFPEGVVHVRTPGGQIIDFVDGAAQVEDEELVADLRAVPEEFELTDDGPEPTPVEETPPAPAVEVVTIEPESVEQYDDTAPKAAVVRAWAKENGVDCPAKGKIPQAVRDAYDAAQAD